MGLRVEDIRLVHRVVGTKHVITSPDVPELHLSHADEAVVRADVQPALDFLEKVEARIRSGELTCQRLPEAAAPLALR